MARFCPLVRGDGGGGGWGNGGLLFHFSLSKIVAYDVLSKITITYRPVSRSPVITDPRKAILFAFKIEFLIALEIIRLGNKQKQVIFGFRPETLPGLSRNGPDVPVVQNRPLFKGIRKLIMWPWKLSIKAFTSY